MKLKSITLNNFKGMDNIELSLDQKTTVIFGINLQFLKQLIYYMPILLQN